MALSNNDRVGKALELLNAGLRPFVLREMQAVYRHQAIDEALSTLRSDQERRSAGRDPNRWDTSVLISVMRGRWNGVFGTMLRPTERNLVHELGDIRNRWAHQVPFTIDDTERALDTISRLLKAISAEQAFEIDKQKQEVLSLRYGEQKQVQDDRSAGKQMTARPDLAGKTEGTNSFINHAFELLESGESAIVLFTRGMRLVEIYPDGTGSSGYWVTNPDHHDRPDKVIIYSRFLDQAPPQADIYLASYVDAIVSPTEGRVAIRFRDAAPAGTTHQNWYNFADAGPNPIRYLKKL